MKNFKTYRTYTTTNGAYEMCVIDLFGYELCPDKPNLHSSKVNISLHWQKNIYPDKNHPWQANFYGCHIQSKKINTLYIDEHIKYMRIVKKMFADLDTYDPTPEQVISYLKNKGYRQIIWQNHNPIADTDHGKKIFFSQENGRDYGMIYAFNEYEAIQIAKKYHHGKNEVRETDIMINFNTKVFS